MFAEKFLVKEAESDFLSLEPLLASDFDSALESVVPTDFDSFCTFALIEAACKELPKPTNTVIPRLAARAA